MRRLVGLAKVCPAGGSTGGRGDRISLVRVGRRFGKVSFVVGQIECLNVLGGRGLAVNLVVPGAARLVDSGGGRRRLMLVLEGRHQVAKLVGVADQGRKVRGADSRLIFVRFPPKNQLLQKVRQICR